MDTDSTRCPVVGTAAREQIERDALAERERALLAGELVFRPGPYEAHIGFSNVCNMSCVMCWDGANPPPRKMSPDLLAKVGEQVAPSLSVITPYDGSEPLIVAWDDTREMCERYSNELSLTTNGQFLDERRFDQLRSITETLFVSIDSHVPETFAKIRPGAKPDRIYENLRTAAAAARAENLELIANVVFMTENGPLLPDTVEFLADSGVETVHIMQLLDVNGRSGFLDPLLHFSADYVAALKERVLDVARRRQIRIMWDVAGAEDHDHRVRGTPRKPRKQAYDHWDWRMKNRHPGFCRCAYDRLRINADGFVAPCAYSIDGELELGNLADTPFEEMWNGPRMQDLRRAHHTWDYPAICATCRFKDPVGPRDELPFIWDIYACLGLPRRQIEPSIELIGPDHMTRTREAPELCFGRPPDVEHLFVVLALGGESDEMEAWRVGSGAVSFRVPEDAWERMRANVGWWWTVIGFSAAEPWTVHTGSQTRCLIRHRPLPRIPGSGLVYPDAGHAPVDLGGVRMPVPA